MEELNNEQWDLLQRLDREGVEFDHKGYYSTFITMYPYIVWMLGSAILTDEGYSYIQQRQMREWNI